MYSAVKSVGQRSWGASKPTEASFVTQLQSGAAHGASGDDFDARHWWGIASKLVIGFGWSITPEAYTKLMSYNFPNLSVDKSKIKKSSKSFSQNVSSRIISLPVGDLGVTNTGTNTGVTNTPDVGPIADVSGAGLLPPEGLYQEEPSSLLKYGLPLGIGAAFILGAIFILRK